MNKQSISAFMISVFAGSLFLTGCGNDKPKQEASTQQAQIAPQAQQIDLSKYEGKLIWQDTPDGKRDKVEYGYYYVKNGKKKWVGTNEWMQRNNLKPDSVLSVTPEIFKQIPTELGSYE